MEFLQKYYSNEYYNILQKSQQRLTEDFPALFGQLGSLATKEQKDKMYSCISNYISKEKITVCNVPNEETLIEMFYRDMTGYSVLTDYVVDKENKNEEIDINAWNDVEVIRRDGTKEKTIHFCNPEHAQNVIERMARISGGKIDDATPMVESDLPGNTRFVAMKYPIIAQEDGVAASIRIVRPEAFENQFFLKNGTLTESELYFIQSCLNYGVSVLFIGETSSGKTTLMNCVLRNLPAPYRVYTIETGSRELCLRKENKDGIILNSVVSTLSRLSDDVKNNIDQDLLVEKALRFNPNVVAVGEMRGIESAAAVEVAMTDHTVTTSLHAPDAATAHIRIAQLYCKRYPISIDVAVQMAAQAFPVVVALRCLRDHSRHIMSITECITSGTKTREYRPLYQYHVLSNTKTDNGYSVKGEHLILNEGTPSETLMQRLLDKGMLDTEINQLMHPMRLAG